MQQSHGAEDGPRDLDGLDVLSVPQSFRKHLGGSTVSFDFQGCRATKSRLLWLHTESCEVSRNSWPIWAHRGPFAKERPSSDESESESSGKKVVASKTAAWVRSVPQTAVVTGFGSHSC